MFSPVGANYQGGLLDNEVRVSIQFIHRIGAVVTACYVLALASLILWKSPSKYLKTAAWLMALLVLVQFILGVMNVVYLLPIKIAVAHNGVAALLLAIMFSTLHLTQGEQKHVC